MDIKLKINRAVNLVAQLAIDRASQMFSKIVKQGAKIELQRVYVAEIAEATAKISTIDNEVVGALVDLSGDMPFKFLFLVNVENCKILCDLMLRREQGTTTTLDVYAKSAVQEIGNILASAISNVFATDFEITLKPEPPQVVHDFPGTVFEEYVMDVAAERDQIAIIESRFCVVRSNIVCHMFLLPTKESDKTLNYIAESIAR